MTAKETRAQMRTVAGALEACSHRACGRCPYQGKGTACRRRLEADAAALLAYLLEVSENADR